MALDDLDNPRPPDTYFERGLIIDQLRREARAREERPENAAEKIEHLRDQNANLKKDNELYRTINKNLKEEIREVEWAYHEMEVQLHQSENNQGTAVKEAHHSKKKYEESQTLLHETQKLNQELEEKELHLLNKKYQNYHHKLAQLENTNRDLWEKNCDLTHEIEYLTERNEYLRGFKDNLEQLRNLRGPIISPRRK